ncbi:uncharacterized protein [Ptychodera flava]|uniref:uncharacterized protein n=1 Tax=Ptychodera flava TaxID=63121 RepID=UPI00396A9D0B
MFSTIGRLVNARLAFRRVFSTGRSAVFQIESRLLDNRVDQQELREMVHRYDPSVPIERAITPPSSWYTSPAMYKLEKDTVFKNNWLAIGRKDQVKRTGQYFTSNVVGEPLVVCRDLQGQLRAFLNVCCHRGMPVAKGEDTVSQFDCSYHGWSYALDGRLLKATKMKGIQNFKAKENGLKPLAVTTWGPLVLVKMTGNSADVENNGLQLEKVETVLKQLDYDPDTEDIVFVKRSTRKITSNWKTVVENFSDGGYHVEVAHKTYTDSYYAGSTVRMADVNEYFTVQMAETNQNNPKAETRIGKISTYIYIYPNFMISRYGPWVETITLFPYGYDSTDFVFDFFLDKSFFQNKPRDEVRNFIDESVAISDKIQDEDDEICEGVHFGLMSSAYDAGRYVPRVEMSQYVFHQRLAKELRGHWSL